MVVVANVDVATNFMAFRNLVTLKDSVSAYLLHALCSYIWDNIWFDDDDNNDFSKAPFHQEENGLKVL